MTHVAKRPKRLVSTLVGLVMISGMAWAGLTYGPELYDAAVASRYQPDSAMQAVIDQLELTDKGRQLLYASQPQLQDKAEFNKSCKSTERTAAILGCYHLRRIYVYNVQNQELTNAEPVTTAHELLHAAYERLSPSERQRIDKLIEAEYAKIKTNPVIASMVKYYDQAEPGERNNELHSIIGTQIGTINSELEQHYSRYFRNRAAIVARSDAYQAVFDKVDQEAKALSKAINQEATQLPTDQAQYKEMAEQLSADIKVFNARAQNGGFRDDASFQAARKKLLARQRALEAQRLAINQRVEIYNAKITRLNALSVRANELNQSINGIEQPKEQV